MAKTFTLTSHDYKGRYLQLYCEQVTDIANNRSTINWALSSIGGQDNYYSIGPTTVTIAGSQAYYCRKVEWNEKVFPAAKGSTSGSLTVNHDTYGKLTIAVSLETNIYDGVLRTFSGNWTLDNIPRQATITSAPDFNDMQLPTVTYSNPAGNNVEALDICIADDKAWNAYVSYRPVNKTGSLSYTFTASDVTALKNIAGNSLALTFVLRTKIGGQYFYNTTPKTFTMTENDDTRPAAGVSASPNNGSLPSAFDGLYIQGKSRVDVSVSADGKYGAKIVSYWANVDGKGYTSIPFTSDVIQSSGLVNISGSAKDSRGFTNTARKQVTVIPYSAPQITSFSIERQADGTTVVARLVGAVSSVENKNTKAFSVTLNNVTKAISATSYSVDGSVTFTDVPTDVTLTAEAKIADAFSTVTKQATVPTVKVTMDLHHSGTGIAMGKVAEHEDLLDIAWDVSVRGSLTAAHIARIDLYNGKDFNELIYNTGYYPSGSTPAATGCSNYPVDITGVLEVISQIFENASTGNRWGFAYQTYRTYTGDIYTRSFNTDTGFTAWKKIQFV